MSEQILKEANIGVIGCGTMGIGIAQVAAMNGHKVVIVDQDEIALVNASKKLQQIYERLVAKNKITTDEMANCIARAIFTTDLNAISNSYLVVEAIIENISIKKELFASLEKIVAEDCILATNTSSLPVTAIASACENNKRVLGVHFFNPAPLMPLVEIIPGIATTEENITKAKDIITSWGKITVLAKDTPGFIVNRIARPFYGEAIRILEEGVADVATIDWAMKQHGFRMGPFELMDLIGNDINYEVTKTVFKSFFYDPRYRPSFTQQRLVEAGYLGRKSGRGYYDYSENAKNKTPNQNQELGNTIFKRILVMIINEAIDAVFLKIASPIDIDIAMTKGVNYPKGPLLWAQEIGLATVLENLNALYEEYCEDRYRPSPLLKRMVKQNTSFDLS